MAKKGLEYALVKKDATRDNLQFADGLAMTNSERVREELFRVLKYQYADGHTVRSWVPMDTVYYCDGPLWIVLTTCGYLKASNNMAFLQVEVPYFDGGSGTVLEHLQRCINRIDEDRGPNKLPLARFADWNDALNLDDSQAESVFMAMGFGFMLKEMAELMYYIGDMSQYATYIQKHKKLKQIINEVAWDEAGQYYVRAFSKGKIVGGINSEGSTIFVNPQTWSILGDIVTEERLPYVLKAVDEKIENDLGCPVNLPAYEQYSKEFGRISAQLPGTWENASSYCHVTSFKTSADVKVGRGDIALSSLKKIMPDSTGNPIAVSHVIPFALTSSYSTNQEIWGLAGRPWLTGTQAWVMKTVVEGLLGVQRAYGGFLINPSFPTIWPEASCIITRGNAKYQIEITRTGGSMESVQVTMNDQAIEDRFIPFQENGLFYIKVGL